MSGRRGTRWWAPVLLVALAGCGPGAEPADPAGTWFGGTDVELASAVSADDADRVRQLAAGGADVEATGRDDLTMLQFAVREDRPEAAAALLDSGADPDRTGYRGGTALELAVRDTDLIRLLLASGADPDVPNSGTGMTALAATCVATNPAAFEALVEAGADVTIANANGDTALHSCARTNQGAQVLRLLDLGADPEARTSTGASFQDYYFQYPADVLSDGAIAERREIVAWLVDHSVPLVSSAEPFR